MQQTADTFVCPKGHTSTEADYCSECGARIKGASAAAASANPSQGATAGDTCPDCGTLREQSGIAFCEVCGYNFVTGAHGEIPVTPAPPPADISPAMPDPSDVPPATPTAPREWFAMVSVDPTLRGPDSPDPPTDVAPYEVALTQPTCLIGRKNETRGIFPELALAHDDAVSRRHALLQLDPTGGLLLRDIGASNGTRLNGVELRPMVDYPVKEGDEITLGHWSRIRVQSR